MREDQAGDYIAQRVKVIRTLVIAAKAYLLTRGDGEIEVAPEALKWAGLAVPNAPSIIALDAENVEESLGHVAQQISHRLAMGVAAWELVRSGVMFQCGSHARLRIGWDYASRGHRGDWRWDDRFSIFYPEKICRPEWHDVPSIVFDSDLYIQRLGLGSLNPHVEDALRLSLACFRQELYVPCVAMLGAASEGAWIELGTALSKRFPSERMASQLGATLQNVQVSTRQKIERVTQLYDQAFCEPLHRASGVDHKRLTEIQRWSDQIRESRNVLHWGAVPSVPNTYEKVAILLMDAVSELTDLGRVRNVT